MSSESDAAPDLANDGILLAAVPDGGMIRGQVGDDSVLLARHGNEVLALGATCTHYGGPLDQGLFDGECVRCPWHHARFSAQTGEAVAAPALDPITTYGTRQQDGRVYVTAALARPATNDRMISPPASVVIVGAGAAGNAAAEMLRRERYEGSITLVGVEDEIPYDRPNLSKDYLAGKAAEEWIPLRSREFYATHRIELALGHRAVAIDAANRLVMLDDGRGFPYEALLLATGAEAVRLNVPGADLPHVHTLRSLSDSRAIIAAAAGGSIAVVIGASFIGLEVAAALRERNVEVHVVAPEERPMERVLGPQLGDWIRSLHEEHGVHFHLGRTLSAIDASGVTLDDGSKLDAGVVIVGVGVRPSLDLAMTAGIADERDVPVNEELETRARGIWAAGDIARWPDPWTNEAIRVEHWVVAERQGQTAARNILGHKLPFREVPFFWSQHYDVSINYVGHAARWDSIDITGSIAAQSAVIAYRLAGQTLAVASIWRDSESLQAEMLMERGDEAALHALIPQGITP